MKSREKVLHDPSLTPTFTPEGVWRVEKDDKVGFGYSPDEAIANLRAGKKERKDVGFGTGPVIDSETGKLGRI